MAGLVLNGFNIGQDISVSFQSDNGVPGSSGQSFSASALGHLMSFDAEVIDKEVDVYPISNGGIPLYDMMYMGWRGKMQFTRVNGNLTGIFIALQTQFFSSGTRVHFAITATVQNRDGTTDQAMFTQCSLSKGKFGDFKANKEVEQDFAFRAQTCVGTGSVANILASTTPLI